MKIKFCKDNFLYKNNENRKKAMREIIEILKTNNLSPAETKYIFNEILQELVCTPIT